MSDTCEGHHIDYTIKSAILSPLCFSASHVRPPYIVYKTYFVYLKLYAGMGFGFVDTVLAADCDKSQTDGQIQGSALLLFSAIITASFHSKMNLIAVENKTTLKPICCKHLLCTMDVPMVSSKSMSQRSSEVLGAVHSVG